MGLKVGGSWYDEALEREGVWLNIARGGAGYVTWADDEIGPWGDEQPEDAEVGRVRVARWENPEHRRMMETLLRRNRRSIDADGLMPTQLRQRLENEAMAHTILKGVEAIDGVGPYTPEVGAKLLAADYEFREAIRQAAQTAARYADDSLDEDAEALGKSSSGGSTGASSGAKSGTKKA